MVRTLKTSLMFFVIFVQKIEFRCFYFAKKVGDLNDKRNTKKCNKKILGRQKEENDSA